MWASGGEASASPWLVHTLRRTALGPKDASTPSALGVAAPALVISGSDWHREELARTGSPPPGHGRCSFDTHRGTPASHTLEPGRGAMQGFRAVRTTRRGAVRSRATAPMRARPRAGRASLAGTAPRATPRSACCRTVSSARLPGTLDELEEVVAHAERASSLLAAANALRTDAVALPGAMRWVRRRVQRVHHVLVIVIGLLPHRLARCVVEVAAVRARLHSEVALRALRTLVAAQLPALPAPLGFHPHRLDATKRHRRFQHKMGPDPPARPS